MIQSVIVFVLVAWAAWYTVWNFMPTGWRRTILQACTPLLGRKMAESPLSSRAAGCHSCRDCKGCD